MKTIKTATKAAHTDMIIQGLLDKKNKYSIRIRKDFNTACWSFRPPHHIFIGDGILSNVRDSYDSDISHYVESYLYHEVGHSLFTERDLKSIDGCLKSKSLSFQMHNLFEDARIEHLMRIKTNRAFRWLDYEKHPLEDTKELAAPLTQYFTLIQAEYSFMSKAEQKEMLKKYGIDSRVVGFYKETIACEDSWAVIDVMEAWVEVFPLPPSEMLQQLMAAGYDLDSDLSQALQLQGNDAKLVQLIEESSSLDSENKQDGKGIKDENDHGELLEEFSSYDYTRKTPSIELDMDLILRLAPKLKSIFKGIVTRVNTSRPSKRLSIKGLMSDSEKIYRKEKEIAPAAKRFNLIVDCSGSMHGEPLSGAAAITLLFSKIAASGYVDGHLVLSSTSGYQTFSLPLTQERIEEVFHTHGGEGFSNTFKEIKPLMKEAETNFIITDGMITNGALDKTYLAREGIYTFGIYVGDPDFCNLDKWFHRGIARETLTSVVDELCRQILVKPL